MSIEQNPAQWIDSQIQRQTGATKSRKSINQARSRQQGERRQRHLNVLGCLALIHAVRSVDSCDRVPGHGPAHDDCVKMLSRVAWERKRRTSWRRGTSATKDPIRRGPRRLLSREAGSGRVCHLRLTLPGSINRRARSLRGRQRRPLINTR